MDIDLSRLDTDSREDLDEAIFCANRYYQKSGSSARLAIDDGPPGRLILNYRGKQHHVRMSEGGWLLFFASLTGATAVSFNCRIRWKGVPNVNDSSVPRDARNSLFFDKDGSRKSTRRMCTFLVHEMHHKLQQLDHFLGNFGFAVAYGLTLGIPYELATKTHINGANNSAEEDANNGVAPQAISVTLNGPSSLCEGKFATYTASGNPPGGTFVWVPYVQEEVNDIKGVGATTTAGGDAQLTVTATDDEGTGRVTVYYVIDGNRAAASVLIELCEP